MKYIQIKHVKKHAVFSLWEDQTDAWYEMISLAEGKQRGLLQTKLRPGRIDRNKLEHDIYSVIMESVPGLKREGSVQAMSGIVIVPLGAETYKEGWLEC